MPLKAKHRVVKSARDELGDLALRAEDDLLVLLPERRGPWGDRLLLLFLGRLLALLVLATSRGPRRDAWLMVSC